MVSWRLFLYTQVKHCWWRTKYVTETHCRSELQMKPQKRYKSLIPRGVKPPAPMPSSMLTWKTESLLSVTAETESNQVLVKDHILQDQRTTNQQNLASNVPSHHAKGYGLAFVHLQNKHRQKMLPLRYPAPRTLQVKPPHVQRSAPTRAQSLNVQQPDDITMMEPRTKTDFPDTDLPMINWS